MNIKGDLCVSRHLLAAITLSLALQNWKCLHVRNRQYIKCHTSNFRSRPSLGRKTRFIPLGFGIQRYSDHETPGIKYYSVGALNRYIEKKNLIYGGEKATI